MYIGDIIQLMLSLQIVRVCSSIMYGSKTSAAYTRTRDSGVIEYFAFHCGFMYSKKKTNKQS